MTLHPKPGFDWTKVSWGAPDEAVSSECSYCGDTIPEDAVPLRLSSAEGWAAQFCDHCQERWWGIQSFPDPIEPRHEPEVMARAARGEIPPEASA